MPQPEHTWLEVLQDQWWVGAVAFGVAIVATPLVRLIAYKTRLVDRPDDLLKPHGRPIAYLGGIAMYLGLLAGLAAYICLMPNIEARWSAIRQALPAGNFTKLMSNPLWNLLAIALSSAVITIVGLFDDIRRIKPRQKVYGQILAAGILLVGGIGNRMAIVILPHMPFATPLWLLSIISVVMCVILVIATCNATNFLDGLDGLCSGVTGIIALGFLALAVWLAMWGHAPFNSELRVGLCLAMAGAVLGFLPYNMPPASIFMGDSGSMLLGFFVATSIAMFCCEGNIRWVMAACGIFALPIIDTGLAVVRRVLRGRSIFAGDRSHLYDQLVDRGMTVKQVVVLFYILAALTAFFAVVLAITVRARYAAAIYAVLLVAISVILHKMGMVTPPPRRPGAPGVEVDTKILNILFTSAGRRVSLLREFRRAATDLRIQLNIHAADSWELAPALQVADRAAIVPTIDSKDYIDSLLEHCRRNEINALIPLIDTELLVLAEARDRFEQAGTRAIVSSPEVIGIATDKILTAEFLAEHDLLTPRILTGKELDSAQLPLFTKPRFGSASHEVNKITTAEELAFFRGHRPDSIIQEFIHGVEHTVDVFVDFNGRPLCAVPRRRHEVRGGEVTKAQTVRHKGIIDQSLKLVEALGGCAGMITVQCFLTPDDRVVFIEINPRFGGGVPLSIQAGADSPKWLLELLLGRTPAIEPDCWTDGMLMLRYEEGLFTMPPELPHA